MYEGDQGHASTRLWLHGGVISKVTDPHPAVNRAFLSYSSRDGDYVAAVAEQLGRAHAIIDSKSFAPGEDFRTEIRRHLDESDAFVFFVSPASLASDWCQLELDEAELRMMSGALRRSLAIYIGADIDVSVLPDWLSRVLAVRHTAPAQSVHAIQELVTRISATDERPFVGRHKTCSAGRESSQQALLRRGS